ncbi:hypothetical protein PLANPX_0875 [Lacipirellula parvula]|uniref:Alpha glucuronidase N-terminal domain-containing protein n=2 Tax=Lacipirellula parvula TaxID=2650471 RepID=A0A5K7XA10_9BACT|nr:hypothetical protein PLANPX_0875 [Lacipirellula parvula]
MTILRMFIALAACVTSASAAIAQADARPWLIVTGTNESPAVVENITALQQGVAALLGMPVSVVADTALTAEQRESSNLLVVGQCDHNSMAAEHLAGRKLEAALRDEPKFVQQQGYVVSVKPAAGDSGKVIVAAGWNPLGAIYAASHLRTHLQRDQGELLLQKERTAKEGGYHEVFRPSFEERGVYYNVAWQDLGDLTPINWTDEQWRHWVDKAVCAQFTHIYFFLWSEHLCFDKSPATNNKFNRTLHERIATMIRYAHQRGLKVTHQFSPTLIPRDIFKANELTAKASIEYAKHGFPVACWAAPDRLTLGPYSWNGVRDLATDAYASEVNWFREADEFSLVFYDPGGCFCGPDQQNCREHQALRMMEQVDAFRSIVKQANPAARYQVHLWAIWALEETYKVKCQDQFLDLLQRYRDADPKSEVELTVIDRLTNGGTTLEPAMKRGLRRNGFIFPTNVESGCNLLIPMLGYFPPTMEAARQYQVDAVHHMRIEEPSKFANSYIASRFFWNSSADPHEALREYVEWIANDNAEAADQLYEALVLLDSFMCEGAENQDHLAKGKQIESLVASALNSLGPQKAEELEWLATTSKAIALIGAAIGEPDRTDQLSQEFAALMASSPTFAATHTPLGNYVGWIKKGWNRENF